MKIQEKKKKARRGLMRKKFNLNEFLADIRNSPVKFLDVCFYAGTAVKKFRQTKRILRLISENEKCIIVLPRGASKSFSLALIALWYFYTQPNFRVAIFSRSHRQSKAVLEICSDIIDASPLLKLSRQNFRIDQKQRLKSGIGSEISAHPYDASTVLGEHPDIILADECSFYSDDTFFRKVVLPMLSGVRTLTKKPRIVLSSTFDEQKGFFYEVFCNSEKYEYNKLLMNWKQCDGYSAEDMRKKKQEIGEKAFASQYECIAGSVSSSFFSQELVEKNIINEFIISENSMTIGGIDLAKKKDYASITICEVKDSRFYIVISSQVQLNFSELAEMAGRYEKEYATSSFLVDTTTGEEFVDFGSKQPYNLPLKPFYFSTNTKRQILDYLRIIMEQRRLCIPAKYTELISDLKRYNLNEHLPDSVASLALCVWNEKQTHKEKKVIKQIFARTNE